MQRDHSHLLKHFPALCRAISARHRAYAGERKLRSRQQICTETQRVTREIDAQGLYPSQKRVRKALSKHGHMQLPEVRAAWRETLRELGWEL